MTKRSGVFDDANAKKSKVDINWDEWGEDPDLNDLEDCIVKASQQVIDNATQRNNTTLPTYDTFIKPKTIYSSTQANTSNITHEKVQLTAQIRQLEEQIMAKNGEVSILRAKMTELKVSAEADLAKKEKEWNEKYNCTIKEMNVIKSSLDFKTLEIANLKQKICEITKKNLNSTISTQSMQNETKSDERKIEGNKIFADYPRRLNIPNEIFNTPKPEKPLFNINIEKDLHSIPCSLRQPECEPFLLKNNLNLSGVYKEISILMKMTVEEINHPFNETTIKSIICVCGQLLYDFYTYVSELQKNTKTEDIRKVDKEYLQKKFKEVDLNVSIFDGRECCEKEIGIRAKRSIALLTELFPSSSFLNSFLSNDHLLDCKNESSSKKLSYFENNQMSGECFFAILMRTVKIIGHIRLTHYCTGFLCAVTKFAAKLSESRCDNIKSHAIKILKEVVCTRPNYKILYELSSVLPIIGVFYEDLCNLTKNGCYRLTWKDEVLYFSDDSCLIQILVMLYKETILKWENFEVQLKINGNLLAFVDNLFKTNIAWMCYKQKNTSECLSQVVELTVKIVYKSLDIYLQNKLSKKALVDVIKLGIRILHIMSLKVHVLVEKYIGVCSQYKYTIKKCLDLHQEMCLNEDEVTILSELMDIEEMPNIESAAIEAMPLW